MTPKNSKNRTTPPEPAGGPISVTSNANSTMKTVVKVSVVVIVLPNDSKDAFIEPITPLITANAIPIHTAMPNKLENILCLRIGRGDACIAPTGNYGRGCQKQFPRPIHGLPAVNASGSCTPAGGIIDPKTRTLLCPSGSINLMPQVNVVPWWRTET